MPENYDLTDVIADSLTDAQLPTDEPTDAPVEESPTPDLEASPEPTEAPLEANTETPTDTPEDTPKKSGWEDFDKKFGIDPAYPSGRENRIPYSRVKKIAQKAVRDARKEWEAEVSPKSTEYKTKIKSYEDRLSKVDQFEKVMVNNPGQFLEMLSTVPAYKQFFQAVEEAISVAQQHQGQPQPTPTTTQPTAPDDMPQPDRQLSDGSMVYSMDGLKALLAWQGQQVEGRVTKQVEDRYKPLESEWQAQQRINQLKPVVNQQIAEARTWRGFTNHESEIVEALKQDQKLSLEGAYRKVVLPKLVKSWEEEKAKLVPSRNKMREELLAELKGAPKSTAVSGGSSSSVVGESTGPKSLEDIIAEEVKKLKR
jgi:hypothetical protein